LFGLGVAMMLGGFCGREYSYDGLLRDVVIVYWPHLIIIGGFLCGTLLSMRFGPFMR
jgi:hypothetical protein